MTPTLPGRWQTRILLYLVLGLPISFVYGLFLSDWRWPPIYDPLVFLTLLLCIGLILDVVYIQIQKLRWDHDWPFAFQFVVSILEFLLAWWIMDYGVSERIWPFNAIFPDGSIPFETAAYHFAWVFIPSFIALLGFVQIFFVRWRFKGGELGRLPSNV